MIKECEICGIYFSVKPSHFFFRKSCSKKCFGEIQRRKWLKAHPMKRKVISEKVANSKRGKRLPKISGSNHYCWKGGVTKLNESIRKSIEYRAWRNAIFKRDNWTCQFCGKRGGYLNIDHIKSFSKIIEENNISSIEEAKKCKELWTIENGRVLCPKCHQSTETYGRHKKVQIN